MLPKRGRRFVYNGETKGPPSLSLLPVPSKKNPISDPGVETTDGTSGVNSPQPERERKAARRGEEDSLKTKFYLKGVDAFPGVGEDSILAARRGRRGHRRGAPPAPAASQLSVPELPRLDTALLARRPAWVVATSGLRASPGHAGGGWGARAGGGQPGAPGASGVFRIPERLSLRRALQALAANWFAKEVCGFSSSSFPRPGQRQISRGRGPWRRGLLRRVGFPSGLSEPVCSQPVSGGKEERKTTDPFSSLRGRGKGRSACASLVRTGKSKPGRSGAGRQQLLSPPWMPAAVLCPGATEAGRKSIVFAHLLL